MEKITRRIVTESGVPRLFPVLAEEISASDLQSLLLDVYRIRARTIQESDVLARSGRNPLFVPSGIEGRLFNKFDQVAFGAASDFEAVDLSPVCPLGTNFALGGTDQNHVLTTVRNAEALGDSTPALALECARRRRGYNRGDPGTVVRLCSSHRVIRLQPFDVPGFTPHFRLFGLVSAGRDRGSDTFEIQHLGDHIRFYLNLFRGLNLDGFSLQRPLVEISDLSITEALLADAGCSREDVREVVRAHRPGSSERFLAERGISLPASVDSARLARIQQRMIDPLKAEFPEGEFRFNVARLEGLGYYSGLCLRISPEAPDGVRYPIADGGFTDWTARLLQDRKERLLISGVGSEFVCRRYTA
jgi:hypothetical protein